jgi:hypothetical protein
MLTSDSHAGPIVRDTFCGKWTTRQLLLACFVSLSGCNTASDGEQTALRPVTRVDLPSITEHEHDRITRLFWQDREDATIKWADLFAGDDWTLQPNVVQGFPELDAEKQNLVQMEILEQTLLVGVRDSDDGRFQSGWLAIDTGVRTHSHGDHDDWVYESAPTVRLSRLDVDQGNPAHLYVYDGHFFLANDRRNGFTLLDPRQTFASAPHGTFYPGGGKHITLAAAGGSVCYATWIDGGGPHKGQVDVVDLTRPEATTPAYSLHLPTGGLHGATENSGRIFLAPSDGICWVSADLSCSMAVDDVRIYHLSLGSDPETDKPLRTGAFVNHRNWILFTTGSADASALCLVDAAEESPKVVKLPIDVPDGLSLVTPRVVQAHTGKRYAFIFQDRKAGEAVERLSIIDLDPDGDRNLSDARIATTIDVAASKVDGHYGHHSVCFDPEGRFAFLTNPGEGSVWILDLENLDVHGKLIVGGTPGTIRCDGGAAHD